VLLEVPRRQKAQSDERAVRRQPQTSNLRRCQKMRRIKNRRPAQSGTGGRKIQKDAAEQVLEANSKLRGTRRMRSRRPALPFHRKTSRAR